MLSKDFDCDCAVETSVPGTVYLTHPACAQRRQYLVRAKACARGNGHFFTCAFQLNSTFSAWGVVSSIRELTRNRVPSGLG